MANCSSEAIIQPGNEPSFRKFMDLNMMVMLGGASAHAWCSIGLRGEIR
jgi:hypothetical protein